MSYYLEVLRKYKDFSGRARRKEYWFFVLFNTLITFTLGAIEGLLWGISILGALYSLFVLIPSFAVSVRRLHDTGKSGWLILICLIPVIGSIILLVFLALDSEKEENSYGPNPKAVEEAV